jgi:sugar transferase (PEP-CTERM system associated)
VARYGKVHYEIADIKKGIRRMHIPLTLIIGDVLLSVLARYVGWFLRFGEIEILDVQDFQRLAIFILVVISVSYIAELYNVGKYLEGIGLLTRIVFGLVVSFAALTAFYYMLQITKLERGVFTFAIGVFGVAQFLWHSIYRKLINSSAFTSRVVVLGTGPLARKIGELIIATNHQNVLAGYVNLSGESLQVPVDALVHSGNGLISALQENKVQKLIVSLSERRGVFPVQDVLDCKFCGIDVIDAPTFYEELTGKLLIENTTPSWFIFSNGFKLKTSTKFIKRIEDIVLSLIGLIITIPFLPLIALIIKIDSRGPVFFKQVRVGELNTHFELYKLRTMRQDAESSTGAVWAQKNDPRVTRFGNFLRKMRIDELPQLYNVLRGDMGFLGPRPERPEFVSELKKVIPYYAERHFVKPGVTGWAQIRYPYGASVEDAIEKLRYDLYYIKNVSILLDMHIIVETIKVMLFGKGAR